MYYSFEGVYPHCFVVLYTLFENLNLQFPRNLTGMKFHLTRKTNYVLQRIKLWRVNGCQQGFRSVASFGFGGQESASKPPQGHMQTVITNFQMKKLAHEAQY